jgi:hypothetical protein
MATSNAIYDYKASCTNLHAQRTEDGKNNQKLCSFQRVAYIYIWLSCAYHEVKMKRVFNKTDNTRNSLL